MLISVKRRFIFVANSKAASTSIEEALYPFAEIERGGTPARKHIGMQDILREYDFLFRNPGLKAPSFFAFGVMRDPLDWISSWFRYRRGNKVASPLPKDISFAEFWAKGDWNRFAAKGRPRLQRDFFADDHGRPLVDMVIPYQDLGPAFAQVTDALGLKVDLGHMNASKLAADADVIPADLVAEVRSHYAADYEFFSRLDDINAKGLQKLDDRKTRRAARLARAAQSGA